MKFTSISRCVLVKKIGEIMGGRMTAGTETENARKTGIERIRGGMTGKETGGMIGGIETTGRTGAETIETATAREVVNANLQTTNVQHQQKSL